MEQRRRPGRTSTVGTRRRDRNLASLRSRTRTEPNAACRHGRWSRYLPLALVAVVLSWGLSPLAAVDEASAITSAAPLVEEGYISVGSGENAALLHYNLVAPADSATTPVPTILTYSGYGTHELFAAGVNGYPPGAATFTSSGYAVLVVAVRGTGCSSGTWRFMDDLHASDGYAVVEWAASQRWSNRKVALFGESYGAFIQFPVAALQPPHLVGLVAAAPFGDAYRDVMFPGGIPNPGVAAGFSGSQNAFSAGSTAQSIGSDVQRAGVDALCARHQSERPTNAVSPVLLDFASTEGWDGPHAQRLSPAEHIGDVDVPTLSLFGWNDELLGSRGIDSIVDGGRPFYLRATNATHEQIFHTTMLKHEVMKFLEHHVREQPNGFDEEPRIKVLWEPRTPPEGGVRVAGWTTGHGKWPVSSTNAHRLYFGRGSDLSGHPDAIVGSASFVYQPGTGQAPTVRGETTWGRTPPEDGAVVFTSPPLVKDLVAVGTASVDLWLSSTAPDTDVQVTLTEIRGSEERYVQTGWLRASHRALDSGRSSETRPYHTHNRADASPLVPGVPSLLRVEVLPFAHTFRAGSRVRIWVEAPAKAFGGWALEPLPGAMINSIHVGGAYASSLVLPVLPGHTAGAVLVACGAVTTEVCRPATG